MSMYNKLYYVTTTKRHGFPEGTPLLLCEDQSDFVGDRRRPGEKFYCLQNDYTRNRYPMFIIDITAIDPFSRDVVGPWFLNATVRIESCPLRNEMRMYCEHSHMGLYTDITVTIDPVKVDFEGDQTDIINEIGIVVNNLIKSNNKMRTTHNELILHTDINGLKWINSERILIIS